MIAMGGRRRTLQLISTGLALWAGTRRLRRGRIRLAELLSEDPGS
jgi:predicted ATPase